MGAGRHGHSHEKSNHKSNHGHSHSGENHSHDNRKKFLGCCYCSNTLRLGCMLSMTFVYFLVELIVGQITNSIALTADSFHMLSDALALLIGLFTVIISKRKTTKNTFGWVRAEVLGPLINSIFLASICLSMVIEAVKRLIKTEEIEDVNLLLYVGITGLLINLIGLFLFGHGHGHSHSVPKFEEADSDEEIDLDELKQIKCIEHTSVVIPGDGVKPPENDHTNLTEQNPLVKLNGKASQKEKTIKKRVRSNSPNKKSRCHILSKEANMNMKAVFLHVLADALGSVIVILSALLNKYKEKLPLNQELIDKIDPILSILSVALILSSALPLAKESALILLQTVPKEIEVKQLKQDLVNKISGVSSVHELHIWSLSGRKIIATAHVTCHNTEEYMEIAAKIKKFFHEKGIHSTTIQPEFTNEVEGGHDNCILECKEDCNPNTCCGQTNGPISNNTKSEPIVDH